MIAHYCLLLRYDLALTLTMFYACFGFQCMIIFVSIDFLINRQTCLILFSRAQFLGA